MTGFINFSVLAFLSANGEAMFVLLFTDKWISAVPFFQILCIEGLFLPIFMTIGNILIARGKSSQYMKIEIAKRIIQTIVIVLTISSIELIVLGQLSVSIIFTLIGFVISYKEIDFLIFKQIKILLPYLILAGIIFGINFVSNYYFNDLSHLFNIVFNLIISLIVYLSVGKLFKLEAFLNILEVISEKINKRKV